MTARFIHTADWQIGKNFDRVENPDKRARLRDERLRAVGRIGDAAREHGAHFVLVAGDLFDSPTATRETVAAALGAVGRLGIPVFAIPGNHDHGGPGGLWEQEFFRREHARLAPNFSVLLERTPHDAGTAWILPCPLLRRSDAGDPAGWLREDAVSAKLSGGKPVILLAHGSTQTFGAQTGYEDDEAEPATSNLIDLDRIPAGAVDYVALGDWHGTKEIRPWAWYPGTPEPDRFTKGGDHDPGNVLAVTVTKGSAPEVRRVRTAAVGWHALHFDLAGDSSVETLEREIEKRIGTRVGEDLLQLDLDGQLGLCAASALKALLESLDARLLRLKLRDRSRLAPTDEEVAALTKTGDPLFRAVATRLVDESRGDGERAEIARVALRELHAAHSETQ